MRLNTDRRTMTDDLLTSLHGGVRRAAFWTAVALPFVLLSLLALGLSEWRLTAFAALIALDLIALVVGHDYAACPGD